MDRREILVLKPDAAIRRTRTIYMDVAIPMLGKTLLLQNFLTPMEAINYAIEVKQRYLKLKEHECTNQPTT